MRRAAPCFDRFPALPPSLNCPPVLFRRIVGSQLPEVMAGRSASYTQVLVETEAPIALYKHLARYWAVRDTPPEDPGGRVTCSNADPATGTVTAVVIPVLEICGTSSSARLTGSTSSPSLPLTELGKSLSYITPSAWGETRATSRRATSTLYTARSPPLASPWLSASSSSSLLPTSPSWGL